MKSSNAAAVLGLMACFLGCSGSGSDKGANAPAQQQQSTPPPPGPPGCGLKQAAFCDTFDTPSPGGRGGDLDDNNWSVARISTMIDRSVFEPWAVTTGSACGQTKTGVAPNNDIFFCAGGGTSSMHLNDVEDDNGGFTIHSYRVRKPFDFTNRTGVIAFDVAGKGQLPGGHGFWFNITIADEPVPAPYQQGGQIALFAKAAVIIEFEAGGTSTECAADGTANSVSTIYVEKDYKITNSYQYLIDRNPDKGCFKTVEEVMNHFEIRISKSSIEVVASDAGDPSTMRTITKVDANSDQLDLPLTKGWVNFQQTHYNAEKSGDLQSYTTYHWDNIGFDGPSYPTPRSYQVPDSLQAYTFNGDSLVDVGYLLTKDGLQDHKGAVAPIKLSGVDLTNASDATITLNAWAFCPGETLGYRFNGGPLRSYASPFPLACEGCDNGNTPVGECDHSARAVVIPVQLSDLKQGDNTVAFTTSHTDINTDVIVANIDLTVNVNQ